MAFDFAAIRPLFGGHLSQPQVDGINVILESWEQHGDGDNRKLAYLLGTARHETASTMQPITERGAKSYFNKYEPTARIGKALGNTLTGDGYRFRGRGFVQITGRANYAKVGKLLSVDLLADPDRALEPVLAAAILIRGCLEGWFTGKKLGNYILVGQADYVNARRVVNGTDKADLIAGYASDFLRALSSQKPVAAKEPVSAPVTPPNPVSPPQPVSAPTGLAAFFNWLALLFTRKA